jgi:hypothetical protein
VYKKRRRKKTVTNRVYFPQLFSVIPVVFVLFKRDRYVEKMLLTVVVQKSPIQLNWHRRFDTELLTGDPDQYR